MSHLPPPNWNLPPNSIQNGCHPAIPGLYGQQPYNGFNTSYQPYMYTPPYQTSVPIPSIREGPLGSKPQSNESKRHGSSQSTDPTTAEFSCDVCERFFKTKQILEAHLQSHVKCDHEGCSFTASRKMMKLHFIQNHAKGRMRIKLDTPEEIEKWREQRRKKYPTIANVKRKLEEENARREKGQVAHTQNFRYHGNRRKNRPRYNQQQSKYQNDTSPQNNHREGCQQTTRSDPPPKEEANKIKGDPLSVLLGDNNSESDNEAVLPSDVPPLVQPSSTPAMASSSALMALSVSYGGGSSSDESDTDINKEVNNNDKVVHSPEQNVPVKMTTTKASLSAKKTRKRKRDYSKNGTVHRKKKVTLLEKLLAPQIRHENNVILQCLRYIVNNHYFGVAKDNSLTPLTK